MENVTPRELFTDAMERAFMETLPSSSRPPDQPGAIDAEGTDLLNMSLILDLLQTKHSDYKNLYYTKLSELEWCKLEAQFPTELMDDPDDDNNYTAQEHTEKLSSAAFEDAKQLMLLSIAVIPDDQTSPTNLSQILKHSKNSLLQIARVDDKTRGELFFYTQLDNTGKILTNPRLWAIIQDNPVVEFNDALIAWATPVSDWLKKHASTDPTRYGCPAYYRKIEINNHKTTLINAFWDTIIDYTFNTNS